MRKVFDAVSRRHFLSGLLASVGLASIGVSFERQRRRQSPAVKRDRILNHPHYREKKPLKFFVSTLAPGFYLYKKKAKKSSTAVIHVVESDKRIRGVEKLEESRLEPLDPLRNNVVPRPHVNRSTASHSLETAALAELTSHPPRPEIACQLLMLGINDTSTSRLRVRKSLYSGDVPAIRVDVLQELQRKQLVFARQNVPVRLYDLLAGLSVRYEQRSYLQKLVSLVEVDEDLKQALPNRLSKWKDLKSGWHKRWKRDNLEWNNIKLPKRLGSESSNVG